MAGLDNIIKSTQWAQNINKLLGLSSQLAKSFQQQEKFIKNISGKGMLTELTKSLKQQELYAKNWRRTGSLADLFNPLTMPPALVKPNNELDKAVDAAYSKQAFTSEAKRMELLFELYEKYIAGLFVKEKKRRSKK